MSLNKVILQGNLTRACESKEVGNGLTTFGLAINRRFKNKDGEQQEEVCFVDVEMWGPRGDAFARYHSKGSMALIEGRLRWHSWETDDGSKRSKLGVVAEGWEFCSSGKKKGDGWEGSSKELDKKATVPPAINESDIPF